MIAVSDEKQEKVITFKLSEIPKEGCLIKDDYVICREKGEIKVSRVIEPTE